jgi:hypothetical protein
VLFRSGVSNRTKGEDVANKNIWARQSLDPDNGNRTLMVQFSSDLLQKGPRTTYDKLYQNRTGYDRPTDFWELPQWQAHMSYALPETTDHYTIRNIDEAIDFFKNSGYKNIAFSALDVNRDLIDKIATEVPKIHLVVGGYTDMDIFKNHPNVTVYPTIKDFTESEGAVYNPGYDYRLFSGTKTVPRLTMSDGCRHSCVFCSILKAITETGRDQIMQQVDTFARDLPSRLIYINDKTFGQASNHTMLPEIYNRIKGQNPDFDGFIIQTTAAQMKKFTSDFINRAGIKYIELGIESYNDPILKAMKKPANETLINEAAQKIRDAGAVLIPNIMVGLPGETPETYAKTMDWLNANRDIISHANIYNLALYDEAELGRKLEAKTQADRDENIIEKSWMEDPAVANRFHKGVFDFSSQQLDREPTTGKSAGQVIEETFNGLPTIEGGLDLARIFERPREAQPTARTGSEQIRIDDERQLDRAARSEVDRASRYGERTPETREPGPQGFADAIGPSPEGWSGLEKSLQRPPTVAPEVSGISPQLGAGEPGFIGLTPPIDLKPGQSPTGYELAQAIERAPSYRVGDNVYKVVDESGTVSRRTMATVAHHGGIQGLTGKVAEIFDELKNALSGGIDPDYNKAVFAGNTLDPTAFAINYNGDRVFGTDSNCPVFYNPLTSLEEAFRLVVNGHVHTDDIHKQVARQAVVSMVHELVHQKNRTHDEPFHELLNNALDEHKPLLDQQTQKLEDYLSNNNQEKIRNTVALYDLWASDWVGHPNLEGLPAPPPNELIGIKDAREIGDPPRFLSTKWLDKPLKLDVEGTPNVIDIGKAMSDFMESKYGKLLPPKRTIERAQEKSMINRFIKHAGNEFLYQIAKDNSMMEWYQKDIERMNQLLTHARADFEDPSQRKLFSILFGILSPGNEVKGNFGTAMKAYDMWAENGTVPIKNPDTESGSWGNAATKAFTHNLITLQRVIDMNDGDINKAINWLLTEHPVKELNAVKYSEAKRGAEIPGGAETMRLGTYMFGEKVGAFVPNLLGVSSELTMDRWWTRGWNRIMGTVDLVKKWDQNEQQYVWTTRDAPRSWAENQLMRKASQQLASVLKVKIPELQAVLWYYEQSLYTAHGATNKPFSLSQAAEQYLDDNGIPYEKPTTVQPEGKVPTNNREASEPGAHAFAQGIFGWGEPGTPGMAETLKAPPAQLAAPTEEDISFPSGPEEEPLGIKEAARRAPKLPTKIDFKKLGTFVDSFDNPEYTRSGDGWITPNGGIIANGFRSHAQSLLNALGHNYFDYDKTFGQIVNQYGLIRTKIQDGVATAEIFGIPTSSQMRTLRQMENDTDSKLLYDITDPRTHDVFATGQGIPKLETDLSRRLKIAAPPGGEPLGIKDPAERTGGLIDQYGRPIKSGAPGPVPKGISKPTKDITDAIITTEGKTPQKLNEAFRNLYTGERDVRIAQTNQLRDEIAKILSDVLDQEALTFYREFKNRPDEEIKMLLDGSHPYYKEFANYLTKEGMDAPRVDDHVQQAKDRIEKLKPVLERVLHPNEELERASDMQTKYFEEKLKEGQDLGFLHSSIKPEEYITHILTSDYPPLRGERAGTNVTGGQLARKFGFANERTFTDMAKAIIFSKTPATINAVDAMTLYGKGHANVYATNQFINALEENGLIQWGTRKSEGVPADWITYVRGTNPLWRDVTTYLDREGNPQMAYRDAYGPQKLVKALYPITDPNFFDLVPALQQMRLYQAYIKSVELGLSTFHMKALGLSAIANMGPVETINSIKADMDNPEWKARELIAIKSGMTTDILGRNIETYRRMQSTINDPNWIDKVASLPVIDQGTEVAHKITHATFGILQRKFKVGDFSVKEAGWIAEHPNATDEELNQARREIAREVNGVYGGLHWENLGWSKNSVYIQRALLLAPDWTYSNVYTAGQAFKGGPAGKSARIFWAASFGVGMALTAGMSLLVSGKMSDKPTQVHLGKDNKGKDIYSNWFFAGGPNDLVNLTTNVADWGLVGGLARSLGNKAAPIIRYVIQVLNNKTFLGSPIVPKEAGPIAGTIRSLIHAVETLGPIPFSISTPLTMLYDGKEHNPAEYFGALVFAARSRHVVPEGEREITSGYKKSTLAPAKERSAAPLWERITGNRMVLPTVDQFKRFPLDSALSAYESADESTRKSYRPYVYSKLGTVYKYKDPDVRKLLMQKMIELGFRKEKPLPEPETQLQPPPEEE